MTLAENLDFQSLLKPFPIFYALSLQSAVFFRQAVTFNLEVVDG